MLECQYSPASQMLSCGVELLASRPYRRRKGLHRYWRYSVLAARGR